MTLAEKQKRKDAEKKTQDRRSSISLASLRLSDFALKQLPT
ncbi:hypothetical protein RSSM_01158 [Rhodopirellula sallentina SM41]|uniref:Uncharacterized protein n=1 Tax=Rhodopirellula sallentina SM41 TaxID=1263870 RepID=M5U757_9BACT|nr:hypothetical protein RSSM_01158 [Rhodopirellula sallentina SM41]